MLIAVILLLVVVFSFAVGGAVLKAGFPCSFEACPETCSVDQAGLELREIHLSRSGIEGMHHRCLA